MRRGTLLALLLLWGEAAAAPPDLAPAWSLFQQGRTSEADEQVRRLLPSLTSAAARRDARLLLAGCAYLRGETARAEEEITEALSFDPTYQPDPLLLSPDLQQLVRRVAARRRDEIARRSAARRPTGPHPPASRPAPPASRPAVPASRPVTGPSGSAPQGHEEATPIYLAVMPFGVGQLANGHRVKGWVLLGAEGALGATSIACLGAALALRDDSGRYRSGDIDTARALNVVYLVTAYAAVGLMVYGAIDGLYYRRPGARSQRTGWIAPAVLPGGGALSMTHHF